MYNYTNFIVLIAPSIQASIVKDFNNDLFTGTPLAVSCFVNATFLADTNVSFTVTNKWTKNDMMIPTSTRISESINKISATYYNATLYFYPLDDSTDTGEYRCSLTVVPTSLYIQNTSTTANITVMVRGKSFKFHKAFYIIF